MRAVLDIVFAILNLYQDVIIATAILSCAATHRTGPASPTALPDLPPVHLPSRCWGGQEGDRRGPVPWLSCPPGWPRCSAEGRTTRTWP